MLDGNGEAITDLNHIGNLNPFRYRSYYYDTETGLYFLKSRYYDPEVGRFLNMDSIDYADPEALNGLNLYAYCGNNPVMSIDPTGYSLIAATFIGLGILALVGFIVTRFSGDSIHETPTDSTIQPNDVYITDNGMDPLLEQDTGKINVVFYPDAFEIKNSYKIDDCKDMERILEIIMQSDYYKNGGYTRDRYSYLYEWRGHNFADYQSRRIGLKDVYEHTKDAYFNKNLPVIESLYYVMCWLIFPMEK